jgi:uncharacterized membrane protein
MMKPTDEQMEQFVGNLLRAGVMASAFLVLLGGILYLINSGAALPDYRVFRGEPAQLRGIWGILTDAFSFHTGGIIQLGLLVLIATPIARVAFSLVAFALQRDRIYVIVTLIVLAVLLYSLTGGRV